ncbi:hypothetical protein QFZ67_001861 [Streptomyces sp. V1I1]|nr:hypothetical protein [Streptomyces sp. V1I1]
MDLGGPPHERHTCRDPRHGRRAGQHINDRWIRLREDSTARTWNDATRDVTDRLGLPDVDECAVRRLKFGEALPPRLAEATLSARLADTQSATALLAEPVRFVRS